MKIIEQIRWNKLRMYIWDEELKQICGEIIFNNPQNEYIFNPNSIGFDDKQLINISKLVKRLNDAEEANGDGS